MPVTVGERTFSDQAVEAMIATYGEHVRAELQPDEEGMWGCLILLIRQTEQNYIAVRDGQAAGRAVQGHADRAVHFDLAETPAETVQREADEAAEAQRLADEEADRVEMEARRASRAT